MSKEKFKTIHVRNSAGLLHAIDVLEERATIQKASLYKQIDPTLENLQPKVIIQKLVKKYLQSKFPLFKFK